MRMHNLTQALARVNRLYVKKIADRTIVKEYGLIVDYIGVHKNILKALDFYWDPNKKLVGSVTIENLNKDVSEIKNQILKKTKYIYLQFFTIQELEYLTKTRQVLEQLIAKLYQNVNEENFINFVENVAEIEKYWIAITEYINEEQKLQIFWLIAARMQIIKRDVEEIDWPAWKESFKINLEKAIKFTPIVDSKDKKRISLSDFNELAQKIENDKTISKNEKSQILVSKIKLSIKKVKNISYLKKEKLSDKIEEFLNNFYKNIISYEEFKNEIFKMAKYLDEEDKNKLTDKERLVKIFAETLQLDDDMDKEILEKISIEIYETVVQSDNNIVIRENWYKTNAQRKRVVEKIEWILHDNNYPPDYWTDKTEKIIYEIEDVIESESYLLN